jgi:RNA polymerase sigma-70 factor (ECF subfamily)
LEQLLSHLDAAHNLARWLTRNSHDAEDVVQEAYVRAFKSFRTFNGSDARRWLLAIVRNTCYTWLKRNRPGQSTVEFDERTHSLEGDAADPETILMRSADTQLVRQALEELPLEFREALILREMEGLSYKEIAQVADIPVGTVMSRLARGRKRLEAVLGKGEVEHSNSTAEPVPESIPLVVETAGPREPTRS